MPRCMHAGGRTDSDHQILAPVPGSALINARLLDVYRAKMLPEICEDGDDGNHGSTAVQDVHCLQVSAQPVNAGVCMREGGGGGGGGEGK
eukprot:COSAG01_NODE_3761_length_5722_cov_2.962298_12_plen_89_part_01